MEYKRNSGRNRMEVNFTAAERDLVFVVVGEIAEDLHMLGKLGDGNLGMIESMWESMAANQRDQAATWCITEKQWHYLKGLIRNVYPAKDDLFSRLNDPADLASPARRRTALPSSNDGASALRALFKSTNSPSRHFTQRAARNG